MIVMLVWRGVTLTICLFYLAQAKKRSEAELSTIEYELSRAICIEDDDVFV